MHNFVSFFFVVLFYCFVLFNVYACATDIKVLCFSKKWERFSLKH